MYGVSGNRGISETGCSFEGDSFFLGKFEERVAGVRSVRERIDGSSWIVGGLPSDFEANAFERVRV